MFDRKWLACWYVLLVVFFAAGTGTITEAKASSAPPAMASGIVTAPGSSLSPNPPSSPVRLIFIHHSTGEYWLMNGNGDLGVALRNNNYFVSDTNYDWGPADADAGGGTIGDHTDIGHWWNWFRSSNRAPYLADLYAESGQNSSYSRLATNPGGENRIVLFKSCFPNSNIAGNPTDPPPSNSNPLRGQDAWSEHMIVANVKGIYNDILAYFATRQDKLFVLIVSPPLSEGNTDATNAANARAVANWLVNDWLAAYPYHNVAVFDFFNILTTNAGDPNTNDLNQAGGNHHRWWNGAIQHKTDGDNDSYPDFLEYPSGDDHPSRAGNLKATGEFLPLLNIYYNHWQAVTTTNRVLLPLVLRNH